MNSLPPDPSQPPGDPDGPQKTWRGTIVKICLSLILIGIGIAGAVYFQNTAPKARKRPPTSMAPLVQVQTLNLQPEQVVVKAMGTVVAARQIELKCSVAGEIIRIHDDFIEGGLLKKGAEILRIDPKDYQLALAQNKRALADAQYEYEVEQGYQAVAKREWELLGNSEQGGELNAELALRKPHLERARARIEAARADLEKAELDLKRTEVQAPFNAIVLTKHVDVGARITTNEPMALLVDIDQFWVRVSVPLDRLKWIDLPTATDPIGAQVEIVYRDQYRRPAKITKLLNDLGDAGQMARLIATVNDPLGVTSKETVNPPLLIGEFVQVEIAGDRIEHAFRIPRRALRDNDRVWLVSTAGALEIRPITITWRGEDTVLATGGLKEGEQIIVSDLATPVDGMQVKLDASHPSVENSYKNSEISQTSSSAPNAAPTEK